MIEPCLYKSLSGYDEQPLISKSLSKSLKASITLDPYGGTAKIEIHIFKGYGYTSADFDSVQDALNLARGLEAFGSITEVGIYVHAKPIGGAKAVSPNIDTAGLTSKDIESKMTDDGAVQPASDNIKDTKIGWLSFISLDIGKSLKLEQNDHVTLISHVVKFLQPYSERRMQDDSVEEPASFMMSWLKVPAILSFASAVCFCRCQVTLIRYTERDRVSPQITRLHDSSRFNAMIDYHLDLAYDEDTGKPFPTRSQMNEIRGYFDQAKNKIIQASKNVPLRMLGNFHISNHRETVYVDVRVEAERKVLRTDFTYGFSDGKRKEVQLTDVGDLEA
jgi:hypothetical protein